MFLRSARGDTNLKSENCQGYCPETSTKLYVHEYGFSTRTHRSYTARWYWLAPLPLVRIGLHGQALPAKHREGKPKREGRDGEGLGKR